MDGFAAAFGPDRVTRWQVPVQARPRQQFYEENFAALRTSGITAIFAVSDFYALECMRFLQAKGLRVPEDMAVVGFDDSEASRTGYPSLTTVRQDAALRAGIAVTSIEAMGRGQSCAEKIVLPVTLLPRESTGGVSCQNL